MCEQLIHQLDFVFCLVAYVAYLDVLGEVFCFFFPTRITYIKLTQMKTNTYISLSHCPFLFFYFMANRFIYILLKCRKQLAYLFISQIFLIVNIKKKFFNRGISYFEKHWSELACEHRKVVDSRNNTLSQFVGL